MTKATKPKPKAQPTVVHVKVVTDKPVSMKAVREWVAMQLPNVNAKGSWWYVDGRLVTAVSVKRDANIERPQR